MIHIHLIYTAAVRGRTSPGEAAPERNITMDAPEVEQDLKLQRTSPDLLADLQHSLEPFLWKSTRSGKKRIRRRVRTRETDRLVNLVRSSMSVRWMLISFSLSRSKSCHNSSIPILTSSFPFSQMPSSPTCEHIPWTILRYILSC